MNAPRVFVVQQPAFWNRERRVFVPKYDLAPAEKYGSLVVLLNPGNIFKDKLAAARETLVEKLADFTAADYLLAVGDPVAIAAAAMIAGQRTNGAVNMLKWDRLKATYEPFEIVTH